MTVSTARKCACCIVIYSKVPSCTGAVPTQVQCLHRCSTCSMHLLFISVIKESLQHEAKMLLLSEENSAVDQAFLSAVMRITIISR